MIGLSLSRRALKREAHDLDTASVLNRERATVARVEEPLRGADIQGILSSGLIQVDDEIGVRSHHVDTHDVRCATDVHLRGAHATGIPLRNIQRDDHCVLQRGRVGPRRCEVVVNDQLTRDVTERRIERVQLDRRARSIGRHDWLGFAPIATRQQAQELQKVLELVSFDAHDVRRPLVGLIRQFDHVRDGRDRRNAVTERVCQPAEQFVMYSKPARRALAAARG